MLRHANQFGDHYLHHFLYNINAVERYSIKKQVSICTQTQVLYYHLLWLLEQQGHSSLPLSVWWGGIQTQRAPVIGETKKEELARF